MPTRGATAFNRARVGPARAVVANDGEGAGSVNGAAVGTAAKAPGGAGGGFLCYTHDGFCFLSPVARPEAAKLIGDGRFGFLAFVDVLGGLYVGVCTLPIPRNSA
jgi:hypothetical protein